MLRDVDGIELSCADVDPNAVRCARRNVGGGAQVYQGDLYDALPCSLRGRVDILAVNAPYVPTDEIVMMPVEAREHEPRRALDGGADGVDMHRKVAAGASRWLTPGGSLLIETSREQAPLTAQAICGPRAGHARVLGRADVLHRRRRGQPARVGTQVLQHERGFRLRKGAHSNTVDYRDGHSSYSDSYEHDAYTDNSDYASWDDHSTYSSHDGDSTSYEGDVDDSVNTTEIHNTDDSDVLDLSHAVSLDVL